MKILSGLLGTRESTFRIARAILNVAGLTADRTITFPDHAFTVGQKAEIQNFSSSGTWTKPVGYKWHLVQLRGATGGAGSGAKTTAGSNASGGAPSGGGGAIDAWFRDEDLPATVAITIGAKGIGGAAVSADDTSGNAGTAAGNTSFGTLLIAYPGGPGAGGGRNRAAGGGGGAGLLGAGAAGVMDSNGAGGLAGGGTAGNFTLVHGAGSFGEKAGFSGGSNDRGNGLACQGGSVGGGYSSGTPIAGSPGFEWNKSASSVPGGTVPGGNGASTAVVHPALYGGYSSGGAASNTAGVPGGNGGDGQLPGGGASGGGVAGPDAPASGKGGNGVDGYCRITSI